MKGPWGQLRIPIQSTDFTMYNLQPDTHYEFMVLSRNELGNGSYSEIVGAKTLGKMAGKVVTFFFFRNGYF